MDTHSLAVTILCFALGMVLQAWLMLGGRYRSGDGGTLALVIVMSLGALLPFRRESQYVPAEHWFSVCVMGAILFVAFFRERLLPRIGGRILLAWNILLVFIVLRAGWTSPFLLVPLGIVSTLTVVNAFSDIDRRFGWKVFFHAWFTTILVVFAVVGMDFGPLGEMLTGSPVLMKRSPLEMMLTGAAIMYLVTNAFFVVALIPLPGKGQKWKERVEEIRRHMELLARGYVWEKDDPLRSLAVLVALPLLLFATARWGVGIDHVIVQAVIAMMPAFTGRVPDAPEESSFQVKWFARPRRHRRPSA